MLIRDFCVDTSLEGHSRSTQELLDQTVFDARTGNSALLPPSGSKNGEYFSNGPDLADGILVQRLLFSMPGMEGNLP